MVRPPPRREPLFEPLSWRPVRPLVRHAGRRSEPKRRLLTTTSHMRRSHAVYQTCGKRPLTTPYLNVKGLLMQFCFRVERRAHGFIVRRTMKSYNKPLLPCTGYGDILRCSISMPVTPLAPPMDDNRTLRSIFHGPLSRGDHPSPMSPRTVDGPIGRRCMATVSSG